jgi:hypothetical protein
VGTPRAHTARGAKTAINLLSGKAVMAKKPKQPKRTKKLTPAKKLENQTTLKEVHLMPRLPHN